jgi:hypothetical protein
VVAVLSGVLVAAAVLLAGWWGGFAPFPTELVNVVVKHTGFHQGNTRKFVDDLERIVRGSAPEHRECADTRNQVPWRVSWPVDPAFTITCWQSQSVPYYGAPGGRTVGYWLSERSGGYVTITVYAVYRSYGGCMWVAQKLRGPARICEVLKKPAPEGARQ